MNLQTSDQIKQPTETHEALRSNRNELAEEIKSLSRKITELSGTIVALEYRNARLEKDFSEELLRNALLSSENEELKQQIETLLQTQKVLIRDLQRSHATKWYKRFLRSRA